MKSGDGEGFLKEGTLPVKKLAIERLIGGRDEKVINGHSLLGLTVLSLRCFLRNTLNRRSK